MGILVCSSPKENMDHQMSAGHIKRPSNTQSLSFAVLPASSEVDIPLKSEECLEGEVHDKEEPDGCPVPNTFSLTKNELYDYQEPECCMLPKTFPPIKEELHDESDALYYVDKTVKTETKFFDPSLELMVCTQHYNTPENKAQSPQEIGNILLDNGGDLRLSLQPPCDEFKHGVQ
uniref:Uncharacterized protein n=1 Tax=Timema poppense TaxID=170557 RepID=A0A7R9DMV0_TIMPO|nr:unnamed protein product [Timema poppensis]